MERANHPQGVGDTMIDQLPDEILIHILSFLPTLVDMSRTAILSTRWRYLWHSVARFDFDSSTLLLPGESGFVHLRESHDWYISSVNSFIQTRAVAAVELPLVKHLLIRYALRRKHGRHINNWINFAISNRVETLHLEFGLWHLKRRYKLSEKFWYTAPTGLSSLKCLKSLFLQCVYVSKKFVEFILSDCPLLEDLTLDGAGNFRFLNVCSARLKRLKIRSVEAFSISVLSAPYLTSLHCELRTFLPRVRHVPMLTDLTIGTFKRTMPINKHLQQHFCSYLPKLKRLELMILMAQSFEFIEMPRLVALRHLKMTVLSFRNISSNLRDIIKFINICPLLETFALQVSWKSGIPKSPQQLESNQISYRDLEKQRVFESIKVLELSGADGDTLNLEIVEYLISKSPNLQKLTVDTRYSFIFTNPRCPKIMEVVKARAEALCEGRDSQIEINVI